MSLPKRLKKFLLIFFIFIFFSKSLYCPHAEPEKSEISPPKIGNFALPDSQQQGPLFSFGQDVMEKKHVQPYLFIDYFSGNKIHAADMVPGILYSITDYFAIFFNLPLVVSSREDNNRSAGLSDIFVQAEYAFYEKETLRYADEATFVANMTFPTGSTKKQPPTGFGSPSFLLGGTFSRLYVDWYAFISGGTILTTEHKDTKFGNQFLYQGGLGRNIISVPSKLIFSWLVEVNGFYSQKDKIRGLVDPDTGVVDPGGATDPDSGGNVLYITPSLWFSTQKFIAQLGIGIPVVQKLFGNQKKFNYVLLANLGWTWTF